jgi:hypothetical protein
MPWSRVVTGLIIALLFSLSLVGYRFNAALQVNEMVYFVQKALEDLPRADLNGLPATSPDVVMTDFREQWFRFYKERTHQEDAKR